MLGVPENQNFVAVLIVGKAAEQPDGASGATERKSFDDVVTVIGG